MTEIVLNGLIKRRAELAGEIERTHDALRKLVSDLEHLDQTILQFDPDYRVESIKAKAFRPPKDWSNRGQMTRIVLSILRQAAEPLTSRDVALELLVERALDKNDQRLLRLMTKRVGVALREDRSRSWPIRAVADRGLIVRAICPNDPRHNLRVICPQVRAKMISFFDIRKRDKCQNQRRILSTPHSFLLIALLLIP